MSENGLPDWVIEQLKTASTAVVRFVRKSNSAKIPTKGTASAAGYDIYSNEDTYALHPGERKLFHTGLNIAISDGYEGQVRPRSGLALKHGVTVLNSPGTIDADYRGSLAVLLVNLSNEPFVVEKGSRIAQLIISPVSPAVLVEVEDFNDQTERGENGFGSTGK